MERARGFGSVADAPLQGASDQQFLEPGHRRRQILVRPIDDISRRCLFKEAKIGGIDDLTTHQDGRPLHRVLQLADIARPRMADQASGGAGGKALPTTGTRQKMLGQRQDVGYALAQGRQVDRHDIQPIK